MVNICIYAYIVFDLQFADGFCIAYPFARIKYEAVLMLGRNELQRLHRGERDSHTSSPSGLVRVSCTASPSG